MISSSSITTFDVTKVLHPRYHFREWVLQHFPYFKVPHAENVKMRQQVVDNKALLYDAAKQVLEWTALRSGKLTAEYYSTDLPIIKKAYICNDDDQFLRAIASLLSGIENE